MKKKMRLFWQAMLELQSPPFQLLNLLYYSMKIKKWKNGCMNTIILILTIIKRFVSLAHFSAARIPVSNINMTAIGNI